MAYEFLNVIDSIVTSLNYEADKSEQELIEVDARQTVLKSELAALEPRLFRAHNLKSRDDRICAYCFILHGDESPLRPIPGDDSMDRFRCGKCDREYKSIF